MTHRREGVMLTAMATGLTTLSIAKYRMGSHPWEWGLMLCVAVFMLVMSFVGEDRR